MLQRRKFIKNTGLLVLAHGLISNKKINVLENPAIKIGIQLYSVRDVIFKQPVEILKQLAEYGYKNVEHANYAQRKFYGFKAIEFKKILDDIGLKMISGHTVLDTKHINWKDKTFTDEWKYTLEDAAILNQEYVISPWMDEGVRKDYNKLQEILEVFNKCGELCKTYKLTFGYHNHNFEFKEKLNNQLIYDIILQNTDPKLVVQQLDIGNMYGVGGRAMDYINKYPNRFPSLHVKDEIKVEKGEMNDGYESTILGNGEVKPIEVCKLALLKGGSKHFIVEQESYQGKTSMECAKINLEKLNVIKSF